MRLFALLAALIALLAFFAAAEFAMIRLAPSGFRCWLLKAIPSAAVDRCRSVCGGPCSPPSWGAALAPGGPGLGGRGLAAAWTSQTGRPQGGGHESMYLGVLVCLPGHPAGRLLLPKPWVMQQPDVSALAPGTGAGSANRTLSPCSRCLNACRWPAEAAWGCRALGRPGAGPLSRELETLIESNSVTGLCPMNAHSEKGLSPARHTGCAR